MHITAWNILALKAVCLKTTECRNLVTKLLSRLTQLIIVTASLTYTQCMLHTLGQNVALILHDVLGAKVPLSGTIENGSNTCHWKFVTSSLKNKEYNNYTLYYSLHISSSSIFKQLLNYETICQLFGLNELKKRYKMHYEVLRFFCHLPGVCDVKINLNTVLYSTHAKL